MEAEGILERRGHFIDARNPESWPPEVARHAETWPGHWDMENAQTLAQYRENVLKQLVTERLNAPFTFCLAAVEWLREGESLETVRGLVLDELSNWIYGLLEEAVGYALELAPAVLRAVPYATGAELLDAVRAKLGQEGDNGAGA